MTATIGTSTFLSLSGILDSAGEQVELFSRPGVDGVGAALVGSRAEPVDCISQRDVDDAAAVLTTIAEYKAYLGTVQTVIDERGATITNVLVLRVTPIRAQAIKSAVGKLSTTAGFLLICRWTLLAADVAA